MVLHMVLARLVLCCRPLSRSRRVHAGPWLVSHLAGGTDFSARASVGVAELDFAMLEAVQPLCCCNPGCWGGVWRLSRLRELQGASGAW